MSREFSEEFGGRVVIEAVQAGVVVIGDEGVEVGIAFGMVEEAAMVGGAVLRHAVEVVAEAAVEALDHAVGLRPEGAGEAMGDGVPAQSRSKGCWPEGLSGGLPFLSTAKRSVNSEPLSVSMVWIWSGKLARKRSRKPAAVWPRRSGSISR